MEEAWGCLLEKIVPLKARHFNGERLAARESTAAQVIARISTLPMFGARQLIMVQHVDTWLKDQIKTLLTYLARPLPTSCLVLTASKKKGLEKLIPAVESAGKVFVFATPNEREAPRWIQERAERHRKTITLQAASFLLGLVGTDLHLLDRELEKVSVYVGERRQIEIEDVRQTGSAQRTLSAFELMRHVSGGRSGRAVSTLRTLLQAGESPLAVLGLLARQVRLLWQAREGIELGMPLAEIVQRLNLPSFVVRGYAEQARLFSQAELYRAHRALRETDLAMKSTGTSPEMMLETLVLSLCHSKQKNP